MSLGKDVMRDKVESGQGAISDHSGLCVLMERPKDTRFGSSPNARHDYCRAAPFSGKLQLRRANIRGSANAVSGAASRP